LTPAAAIRQLISKARENGQQVRTRLAPTPSGFLHRGNLYNFILNWWLARATGGRVLLRIDDLDRTRYRTEYVDFIFRCLDWLHLDWDEGPSSVAALDKEWSQTLRLPAYRKTLEKLQYRNLTYRCSCSRKSRQFHKCSCFLHQPEAEKKETSLKMRQVPDQKISFQDILGGELISLPAQPEDPVVWKKDDTPSYHLASLTDDLHFGISHVLRGADLVEATLQQICIAREAGLGAFAQIHFGHHPLIADEQQVKLSKSAGSQSVMPELQGTPAAMLQDFASWAGLSHDIEIRRLSDILP